VHNMIEGKGKGHRRRQRAPTMNSWLSHGSGSAPSDRAAKGRARWGCEVRPGCLEGKSAVGVLPGLACST
jgi:ribosomal protein L4